MVHRNLTNINLCSSGLQLHLDSSLHSEPLETFLKTLETLPQLLRKTLIMPLAMFRNILPAFTNASMIPSALVASSYVN